MSQETGERETNGGKRKGERKEDSGEDGERSVGTFWYRWRYQKTRPRNCTSHTVRLAARIRSTRRERSEKSAMRGREAVTFDRSTDDDDERERDR